MPEKVRINFTLNSGLTFKAWARIRFWNMWPLQAGMLLDSKCSPEGGHYKRLSVLSSHADSPARPFQLHFVLRFAVYMRTRWSSTAVVPPASCFSQIRKMPTGCGRYVLPVSCLLLERQVAW